MSDGTPPDVSDAPQNVKDALLEMRGGTPPDVSDAPQNVVNAPLEMSGGTPPDVIDAPQDVVDALLEMSSGIPPDVIDAPQDVVDALLEMSSGIPPDVSDAPQNVVDAPLDLSVDKGSSSDSDNSIESSEMDSFYTNFPGQMSKRTVSEEELLNIPIPFKSNETVSKNVCSMPFQKSTNLVDPKFLDDSFTSSQTCKTSRKNFKGKTNLLKLIKVLTNKLQAEHEEKQHLENIIKGQEKEIMALSRDNLKFELELDEAEAVIKKLTTELENVREEFNTLDKNFKELKFLNVNFYQNEMYQYPPGEVFVMYKQEAILSKKKSVQIKCLLEENKSYKKNLIKLKQENEDLRDKVVKLIEEDIDKKILNFTIEQNRKLELKIKIQRERSVNMGLEFREQWDKGLDLEAENKSFREKIKSLEKINKNDSLVVKSKDNEWETFSISSESEVDIAPASPKTSSPKSIEFLVKKALKQILEEEKNTSKTNNEKIEDKSKKIPNENLSNSQSSGAKTGQNISNQKTICKFYLQKRCIFGYKCRNLHPSNTNQNFIPPWNPNVFPNGVPGLSQNQTSFNPRAQNTYSITGYRNDAHVGKSVGYWSAPPIPIEKTRFSQLSELNLNGNNFPINH